MSDSNTMKDPGHGMEDPGDITKDPRYGMNDPGYATRDLGYAMDDPGLSIPRWLVWYLGQGSKEQKFQVTQLNLASSNLRSNFLNNVTQMILDAGTTLDPDRNNTTAAPETPQWLYTLYNTIAVTMVIFIMLAMGCGIEWATVKPHLKKPVGPIIGGFGSRALNCCF